MRGGALKFLLATGAVAQAAAQAPPVPHALLAPLVTQAGQLGAGWQVMGLPRQTKPTTAYGAARIDDRYAVRIEAKASYGNLVYTMHPGTTARSLRWSWRVDQPNTQADLRIKAGDDAAAKVCVSFDLPIEQLPFVERQKLNLARAVAGQDFPAATLCYVWDAQLAPGTLLDNVYSRRIRQIVLRNTTDGTATWRDESRDITADFLRAFGDEAKHMPPISAIIVAADADNTGATTLSYIADLRLD